MREDSLGRLSECFLEYQYFRSERAYHAALKRLAGIYHCLPDLSAKEKLEWQERLRQATLTDDLIEAARKGITEDVQRIRQILSVGSTWNDDEVLLVLTLRIEIEMALIFLNEHAHQKLTIATDDVDQQILSLSISKKNKKTFADAVKLINKNWGLPIKSRWLPKA